MFQLSSNVVLLPYLCFGPEVWGRSSWQAVFFPLALCEQCLVPSLQSWSEGGRSKEKENSSWLAQI